LNKQSILTITPINIDSFNFLEDVQVPTNIWYFIVCANMLDESTINNAYKMLFILNFSFMFY
jgi:hypothetical protein